MINIYTDENHPGAGYPESYVVLFWDKEMRQLKTIRYYTASKDRHRQVQKYWENRHPRSRYELRKVIYE